MRLIEHSDRNDVRETLDSLTETLGENCRARLDKMDPIPKIKSTERERDNREKYCHDKAKMAVESGVGRLAKMYLDNRMSFQAFKHGAKEAEHKLVGNITFFSGARFEVSRLIYELIKTVEKIDEEQPDRMKEKFQKAKRKKKHMKAVTIKKSYKKTGTTIAERALRVAGARMK